VLQYEMASIATHTDDVAYMCGFARGLRRVVHLTRFSKASPLQTAEAQQQYAKCLYETQH
jgi:hypothetical protein